MRKVVAAGEGLAKLVEIGRHGWWRCVPEAVVPRCLATLDGVPVLQGLLDAFVHAWGGPVEVGAQVYAATMRCHEAGHRSWRWMSLWSVAPDVEKVMRRLEAIPEYASCVGRAQVVDFDAMPPARSGWTSQQRVTPEHFEAADAEMNPLFTMSSGGEQAGP